MALMASTPLLFVVLVSAISLVLSDTPPPDVSKVGIAAVKQWTQQHIAAGEASFAASGLTRQPSPSFWGDRIIYSVVVDRFNNGDLSNDYVNLPPQQQQYGNTSTPYGLPSYRHGGDIQGVIDRLDYLVDLGITTLWITPVLQHNGDYHGYCTTDLTHVDPGFGTDQLFRTMVNECHKRNILVVMDIVVNHLCDRASSYAQPPSDHETCASQLNTLYWAGTPGTAPAQGTLNFASSFFGPLKLDDFFSRCGPNSQADTSGEGPAAVFGDFVAGMYDYDTRNYDFQDIFTALHKYWIAYADIDGFRMDAAKHITEDFIAEFSTSVRDYAKSIGKNNFFVVGEVAASPDWEGRRLGKMFTDPNNPDSHGVVPVSLTTKIWALKSTYLANANAPYPGLTAVYDFAASGTSRGVLLGQRVTTDLPQYFSSSSPGYTTIAGQNDYRLSWIHLEIHDWMRFIHQDPNDPGKVQAGLAYLLAAQGTPIIYYGLEQGFNGVCDQSNINAGAASSDVIQSCNDDSDECHRQDMFIHSPWRLQSAVSEINNNRYIGVWKSGLVPSWQSDPMLPRDHVTYQTTRKLTHIRQSCGPLKYGTIAFRKADPYVGGVFAFSRLLSGTPVGEEILIVVNPGLYDVPLSPIPIDGTINLASGQKYVNLLNGYQFAYTGFQNGQAYLFFNGLSIGNDEFQIWVNQNNVAPFNNELQVNLCTQ